MAYKDDRKDKTEARNTRKQIFLWSVLKTSDVLHRQDLLLLSLRIVLTVHGQAAAL